MSRRDDYSPDADGVGFDPAPTDLTSETIGEAVRELAFTVGDSAGSSYAYALNGIKGPGAWLKNQNIASNLVGIPVTFDDAVVKKVAVATNGESAYTIGVYQHSGNLANVELLGTVSVAIFGQDVFDVEFTINPIYNKKQLAVKIESGQAKDLRVILLPIGTLSA